MSYVRRSGSYHLRSPDWDALTALLDGVCRHKGLLTKSGTPSYGQLARACGLHNGTLHQWRRVWAEKSDRAAGRAS